MVFRHATGPSLVTKFASMKQRLPPRRSHRSLQQLRKSGKKTSSISKKSTNLKINRPKNEMVSIKNTHQRVQPRNGKNSKNSTLFQKNQTKRKILYDSENDTEDDDGRIIFPKDQNQAVVSFEHDDEEICKAVIAKGSKEVFCGKTFEEFSKELKKQVISLSASSTTYCQLDPWLIAQLKAEGYNMMTHVQYESIPKILKGSDVLIHCQTGSGKTLAFIIPAIQYLLKLESCKAYKIERLPKVQLKESSAVRCENDNQRKAKSNDTNNDHPNQYEKSGNVLSNEFKINGEKPLDRSFGTRVLILAPTRELVNQTISVAVRLTIPFPRIVVGAVTGGEKRKSEKARLRKGVTILGSTVGRICDHLDTTSSFNIENVGILILDEADRLLDMGFEKKLRWIVTKLKDTKKESIRMKQQLEPENGNDNNAYTQLINSTEPHLTLGKMEQRRLLINGRQNSVQKREKKSNSVVGKTIEKSFQAVLVSATLSHSVKCLADFVLEKNAEWVNIGPSEGAEVILNRAIDEDGSSDNKQALVRNTSSAVLTIPSGLNQYYVEITLKTRLITLMSIILSKGQVGKVVVFLSNCESVEYHHSILQAVRWPNNRLFDSKENREQSVMKGKLKLPKISKEHLDFLRSHKKGEGSNKLSSRIIETELISSDEDDDGDDEMNVSKEQKELEQLLGDVICKDIRLFKLHGNLAQADRLGYLTDFNRCTNKAVLLTTDVAARGLNLEGVQWVIQVDPPQEIEEYVHRVGRTARIGGQGSALLFLQSHELDYINYLKKANLQIAPTSELQLLQPLCQEYLPEYLRVRRLRNIPSFLGSFLSRQVSADINLLHGARRSFTASYRAYRCYAKEFKSYFDVKLLHLGHFASALCLKESPSLIGKKCRSGVMISAARELVAEHKEKKLLRKRKLLEGSEKGEGHQNSHREFSRVADGVLHDSSKHQTPKKMNLHHAQQLLKGQIKTSGKGKRMDFRGRKGTFETIKEENAIRKRRRKTNSSESSSEDELQTKNKISDKPIISEQFKKRKLRDSNVLPKLEDQRDQLSSFNSNKTSTQSYDPVAIALAAVKLNRDSLLMQKRKNTNISA